MKAFLYGDTKDLITVKCKEVISETGLTQVSDLTEADIAIAPLLRKILNKSELQSPKTGTLIFHPSLLPRHAGPDAIKWAFKLSEKYTGSTWFWAGEKLDGGDICEQEVLEILPNETPKSFYERAVIPSALKLLRFAVYDLKNGVIRKRPQRLEARTYEQRINTNGRQT